MSYEIEIREVPEQPVIAVREHVAMSTIGEFLGRVFGELYAHAGRTGLITSGPPFVIYHAFDPAEVDAEVCVPVIGAAESAGRITARVLPAATVAHTIHVGPYDQLGVAYEAVQAWIAEQGFEASGPYRERYLTGPEVPQEQHRTEIELPVTPVAVAVAPA
jgi:effector-binding domain-containing protein